MDLDLLMPLFLWKGFLNFLLKCDDIGLVSREFTIGPGVLGSIPGRIIP